MLEELGFVNLDWRKGTGKKTSPADSGRDIVAHLNRTDVDKSRRSERWFVDCKHYIKGVPAKELLNLLAWAEAERPDVRLFVVSNFLSNPCQGLPRSIQAEQPSAVHHQGVGAHQS